MQRVTLARGFAALVCLGVILATLTPAPEREPRDRDPLCLACGERGVADFVRNLALFAPFGTALAAAGWTTPQVAVASALLTTGVEVAQTRVPGRHPSLGDAVSNLAGAALGSWAVGGLLWSARRARATAAARLSLAFALVAAGVWQLPVSLSSLSLPRTPYFAHLDPQVGHLAPWEGRVLEARLGELELSTGSIRDSARARALLLEGAPLELHGMAGARPVAELAGIFFVSDLAQREILLVAARGDELVVRVRTRASDARLEPLAWRAPLALASLAAGAPLRLRILREGARLCVRGHAVSACPLGFRAGDGWTLLLPAQGLTPRMRDGLGALWLGAWAFPVGLLTRRRIHSGLALGVLVAALAVAPERLGALPTPPLHAAGAAVGLALGVGLRRLLGGGARAPRS